MTQAKTWHAVTLGLIASGNIMLLRVIPRSSVAVVRRVLEVVMSIASHLITLSHSAGSVQPARLIVARQSFVVLAQNKQIC